MDPVSIMTLFLLTSGLVIMKSLTSYLRPRKTNNDNVKDFSCSNFKEKNQTVFLLFQYHVSHWLQVGSTPGIYISRRF